MVETLNEFFVNGWIFVDAHPETDTLTANAKAKYAPFILSPNQLVHLARVVRLDIN